MGTASPARPVVISTTPRLNCDSRRVSSTSFLWSPPMSAMYPRSMSCCSASDASNGSCRISGGCMPASPGTSSQLGTVAIVGATANASVTTRPSISSPTGSPSAVNAVGATSRSVGAPIDAPSQNPGPEKIATPCIRCQRLSKAARSSLVTSKITGRSAPEWNP